MQLNLNPSLIKDLRALSAEWGVSPTATVRRALRERLQEEGLRSHQNRKQHPNYKPPMTHRTIRLTPGQAQRIDDAAHIWGLSRSATIRRLIDMSWERARSSPAPPNQPQPKNRTLVDTAHPPTKHAHHQHRATSQMLPNPRNERPHHRSHPPETIKRHDTSTPRAPASGLAKRQSQVSRSYPLVSEREEPGTPTSENRRSHRKAQTVPGERTQNSRLVCHRRC